MKKKVLPVEKFDKTYKKETSAVFVAITILILAILIKANAVSGAQSMVTTFYFVIGGLSAIWAYNTAEKQNQEPIGIAFLTFFFPVLMLIILGLSRKRNLHFEIDTSYDPEYQAIALKNYTQKFISKSKFAEAGFVYKYLIEQLPHTEEDVNIYKDLEEKSNGNIPDFIVK